MNIPLNGDVQCTDGAGGQVVAAVLDPVRWTMSHLVIDIKGHGHREYLAPLDLIADDTAHGISLNCSKDGLSHLAPFLETEIAEDQGIGLPNAEGLAYAEFQSGLSATDFSMTTGGPAYVDVEAIPDNELATRHGIPVYATDHQVGQLDELVITPESGQITHVVLKEGHLFGKKEIAVPVGQVDRIGEVAVQLKLAKHEVEQLPSL